MEREGKTNHTLQLSSNFQLYRRVSVANTQGSGTLLKSHAGTTHLSDIIRNWPAQRSQNLFATRAPVLIVKGFLRAEEDSAKEETTV